MPLTSGRLRPLLRVGLPVALATAFVAYAPAHIARGICSGSGRFRAYAVVIGSDGVVRIALCIMLALFGVTHTAPYAFSVALSPLVAVQ